MDDTPKAAFKASSTLASLKSLGAALVASIATRVELAATEIEEERERTLKLIVFGLIAFTFLTLALIVATFGVIAFFWESARFTSIIGCILFYLALAFGATLRIYQHQKNRPRFLESSIHELHKDRQMISSILESSQDNSPT